jgi:hypothetical protein
MTRYALHALLMVLAALGCSKPPDAAESANVTSDAVWRASKAVDDAVAGGHTREQIGPLVQSLASAVQAARSGQPGESDRDVIAAYEDVLAAYQTGLDLWDAQVQRQTQGDGGNDIPVKVGTMVLNGWAGAERYNLPISTETAANGVEIKVVPRDSVQQMWIKARALSDKAAALRLARAR